MKTHTLTHSGMKKGLVLIHGAYKETEMQLFWYSNGKKWEGCNREVQYKKKLLYIYTPHSFTACTK